MKGLSPKQKSLHQRLISTRSLEVGSADVRRDTVRALIRAGIAFTFSSEEWGANITSVVLKRENGVLVRTSCACDAPTNEGACEKCGSPAKELKWT